MVILITKINQQCCGDVDDDLTYPVNAKFMGISSVARSIISICAELGVQVVAQVPDAGPVPPINNSNE